MIVRGVSLTFLSSILERGKAFSELAIADLVEVVALRLRWHSCRAEVRLFDPFDRASLVVLYLLLLPYLVQVKVLAGI